MTTSSTLRSAPGDPIVVIDGAGRTFGHGAAAVVALCSTDGVIRRGDRIAMRGQSGSGKSTFLHLLAGLDTPTTGSVTWPGIGVSSDLRPGPVGLVFQSPSLIPSLNVIENVSLPLILMGHDHQSAHKAAEDSLTRLDIAELGSKLPEELSGGQAQRAAVARVLAHRPVLILADEPTGQLDHQTARVVIDALIAAADDSGAALLVSTHDSEIAARFSAAWWMTDGHLTSEGLLPCLA